MKRFRCPDCEHPIAAERVFGISQKLAKCEKCRRIVSVVHAEEPVLVTTS